MNDLLVHLARRTRALSAAALLAAASIGTSCASGNEASSSGGKGGSKNPDSGADAGGAAGSGVGGTSGASGGGGQAGTAGTGATGGMAGMAGVGGQAGQAGGGGQAGAVDGGGGDADGGIPCEQIPESCNGLDDNCNGTIDEGDPDGGQACTVPGATGVCADGTTVCSNGIVDCISDETPSPEICDGLDNNCNGAADEGDPEGGDTCPTGLEGICAVGTTRCDAGAVTCEQNLQPVAETCNGLDDDCDGVPDNGFGGGDPCTVPGWPVGTPCADGLTNCLGGQQGCTQVNFASTEICDGIDNDCDGVIDNPSVLNGNVCSTGLDGVCASGQTQCSAGTESCVPDVMPGTQTETCNTLDDDCNGTVDDVPNINLECGATNPLAQNVVSWACTTGFCQVTACSPPFADCNGAPGDGCEIDTSQNSSHCNGCGNQCDSTNGTPVCSGSTCDIACNPGFGNCDGDPDNGCETNTNTNQNNCGTCGTMCQNPGGTTTCSGGNCMPVCTGSNLDCDGDVNNGCETDTNTDINNCGACAVQCTNPNGVTSCSGGTCNPICNPGFDDCDGNPNNGCETDLNNDLANCGSCNNMCLNPNGTTSCVSGVCAPVCSGGSDDCDSSRENGCETDINGDIANCGACGNLCTNTCGTTSCNFGTCAPICSGNCASCDGDPDNGCEVDRDTDIANCGACGNQCTNMHGSTACSGGTCTPTCTGSWRDCDGDPDNGCETDISSDPDNCNGCGIICSNPHGSRACTAGACTPTCLDPWDDCDGDPNNGCETNTDTTIAHCGSCDNLCTNPGGSVNCVGGMCQPGCDQNSGDCDGDPGNGCETDITTTSNCGACGNMCTNLHGTTQCSFISGSWQCDPTCVGPWGDCDGDPDNGCETSLNSTSNCGACGRGCNSTNVNTLSCNNGLCDSTCVSGFDNCGQPAAPLADDGCETNSDIDINNCGGCGTVCQQQHATQQCLSGTCNPTCIGLWGNCDGDPNNGCETDLQTTSNCGTCGNTCTNPHGTTSCDGTGNCSPVCSPDPPWKLCTGDPDLGCNVNTNTDDDNCGDCGIDCDNPLPGSGGNQATAASCDGAGSCEIDSCQGGYYDENGVYSDGCECQADSVGDSCTAASNAPGVIGIGGGPVAINNNLTPSATDTDWYVVTFTQGASCSYGPSITVTSGAVEIEVYTTCTGGVGGSPYTCAAGGNSNQSGLTSWSFNFAQTCGDTQPIDPTPVLGTFIQQPATIWVRVKPAASASGCVPYTVSFAG